MNENYLKIIYYHFGEFHPVTENLIAKICEEVLKPHVDNFHRKNLLQLHGTRLHAHIFYVKHFNFFEDFFLFLEYFLLLSALTNFPKENLF